MNKNNNHFALQKEELPIKQKNSFAKNFLDIDFFLSRKSRIIDNIKTEKEHPIQTHNAKNILSKKRR